MHVDTAGQHSIVGCVQEIFNNALKLNASDIHLEPQEDGLRIRYRVDGLLYDQPLMSSLVMHQIIACIKVMAHIDSAEKRVPQDGKIMYACASGVIDLRVSTFPTIYGEKIVVRILDTSILQKSLADLGLSLAMQLTLLDALAHQHGFFIVTGPTGSGKSTTLHALLLQLNSAEKNIISLEDPVEYTIRGITQGYINEAVGFTFQKGIRAALRQDPQVLMIGEIRDTQTAKIAIEAALTGHCVLSTLHTHTSASAVVRLIEMGVEHFYLTASLTAVLAQRLLRKLCSYCRYERMVTDQEKEFLSRYDHQYSKIEAVWDAQKQGCGHCIAGYRGRLGVFELLVINEPIKKMITAAPDVDAIADCAHRLGMVMLVEDGIHKVTQGLTTIDELLRMVIAR